MVRPVSGQGAVIARVAVLTLAACAAPPDPEVGIDEQLAVACADGPTLRGMDVSYYQTNVDWRAVRETGVAFAFIRVSDGLQFIDPRFPGYWAEARAAGVIRGAYQYFRPAQDPIAQANLLLSRMGPLQPGDLPPVLDVEDRNSGRTPAQIAAAVRAWVAHVTAQIGRPPIVYAGLYSWRDLTSSADLTTSPLWVAQYTSAACPDIPAPWTRWMFWQYTAMGTLPSIPGAVDLNLFNGSLRDLQAFTMPGACGDGVCSGEETAGSCRADCPPCGQIAPGGGVIDDGDACFAGGGPAQYLRRVTGSGSSGDLIWTNATSSADEVSFAHWSLYFAQAGRYRVEAYTAASHARSKLASYLIETANGPRSATIDQTAVDGWQSLGEYDFAFAGEQSVHLGDNTGEPNRDQIKLVFDAIRLTRVEPPPNEPSEPIEPTRPEEPGPHVDPAPLPRPAGGTAGDPDASEDSPAAGCSTTSGAGWAVAFAWAICAMRRRSR